MGAEFGGYLGQPVSRDVRRGLTPSCTFHTATFDLDNGVREGTRGLSLGEKPYLDPNSLTRREALEKQGVKF